MNLSDTLLDELAAAALYAPRSLFLFSQTPLCSLSGSPAMPGPGLLPVDCVSCVLFCPLFCVSSILCAGGCLAAPLPRVFTWPEPWVLQWVYAGALARGVYIHDK